jgi:predicted secreted hydrolase
MRFREIEFPLDGMPHDKNIVEWWYFNGNLKGEDGREYAFMDCLFSVDPKRINLPFVKRLPMKRFFFSHHLLSDINSNKSISVVNPIVILSRDSFCDEMMFANYIHPSLKGYLNYEIKEKKGFCFHIKTEHFDLELKSRKKPLLLGGHGFLNAHTDMATYYYSLTSLDAKGTIIMKNKRVKVTGQAWMDHQWADTPYQKVMWNWFSIQLGNGCELVCYEFIRKEDKIYHASVINRRWRCYHSNDVEIKRLGLTWKSRDTGARYPLSWEINIPGKGIRLKVLPRVRKQEIVFGSINYWEGPIMVKGKFGDKTVKGLGFMELVGHPMTKSLIEQHNERFRKRMLERLEDLKEQFEKRLR